MTTPHTNRRSDQPIKLGPRHGYAIEGDHAVINAELEVPPYHPGGTWGLELWATEQPYQDGALTGTRVAEVPLELPTPIGPYVHQVDTRVAARLPLHGRAYAMVLALIDRGPGGSANVHAFAHYPERQTFTAPHLQGAVGYSVQGAEVVLEAAAVFNPRNADNVSGTLSLELWACPVAEAATDGLRLAAAELGRISGQAALPAIERRVAFSAPPAGAFRLALLLREWTAAHGYVTRDRRGFGSIYESIAPERPAEKLRLVPAAAAVAATGGLVSIQTGSVEELAAVKGLNLKLAKEIVKARPFASLEELLRVRGIGDKTLVRLKNLLTL